MSDVNQDVPMGRQRVLVIDDELVIGLSCRRCLAPEGHEVDCIEDPQRGLEAALTGDYDVVLLDLMMPGLHGLEVLRRIKTAGIASEVVIITGHSTVESAVEAMKHGAADYLSKPFTPDELRLVFRKVLEKSALIRENAALRRALEIDKGFEGIIGESRSMERVFGLVRRVAPTGRCWWPARAAPARKWWCARFTALAAARISRSWLATAVPWRPHCWRASCSAT